MVALFGLQSSRTILTPPPSGFGFPHVVIASTDYNGHPTIPQGDLATDVQRFDLELRTALGLPAGTKVLAGGHGFHTGWHNTFASTPLNALYTAGYRYGLQNMKIGGETTWAGAANGSWDAALTTFVNSVPDDMVLGIAIQHEPENDGVQPSTDGGTWENQYGPDWSRMQARFATVVANANRPNVFFAVIHMHITFPGHWAGTVPGVPGNLGFNQRDPENWNPWQHMTPAVRARTILAPDIYTKIEDLAATPTSWTSSTAVVSSTESPRIVTGEPVMVFQSDGTTPTWLQTFTAVSKVGSGTNPRTITFSPSFPSTPSAGSKLRTVELFGPDFDAVVDYVTNAGWGVSQLAISEHTINNDGFVDDTATAWLWSNDIRPALRALTAQGRLAYYAHFNHSTGLASGDNGWVDAPDELVEFGAMARELNVGGGGGTGTTGVAFVGSVANTANTSTPSLTIPAAAASGHYAVVQFSCNTTVTLTDPAGWTVHVSQDSGSCRARVYGKFLSGAETSTNVVPSMGGTASRWAASMVIYSGVHATPIDGTVGVAATDVANTVQTTGTTTTTVADCTVLSLATNRSGSVVVTSWTPPAGYTGRSAAVQSTSAGATVAAADRANVAVGTYGPDQWTSNAAAGAWVGTTLALRPA